MLLVPEGPAEALDRIRAWVPRLIAAEDAWPEADAALDVAQPWPLYTSTIHDLLSGQLLARARLTAWQYLIIGGGAVVALGEVESVAAPPGPRFDFATLHGKDYAEAVVDAVAQAERRADASSLDYELRILRGPGFLLLAAWLHAPGQDDLLIPVRREVTSEFNFDEVMTEAGITDRLRPLAEMRLQGTDV